MDIYSYIHIHKHKGSVNEALQQPHIHLCSYLYFSHRNRSTLLYMHTFNTQLYNKLGADQQFTDE